MTLREIALLLALMWHAKAIDCPPPYPDVPQVCHVYVSSELILDVSDDGAGVHIEKFYPQRYVIGADAAR